MIQSMKSMQAPQGRSFAIKSGQEYFAAAYKGKILFNKSEQLAQRWTESIIAEAFTKWLIRTGREDAQIVILDGRPRDTRIHTLRPYVSPPIQTSPLHSRHVETLFRVAEQHETSGYVRHENKPMPVYVPRNVKTLAAMVMFLTCLLWLGSVLADTATSVNTKAQQLAQRQQHQQMVAKPNAVRK